MSGRSQQLKSQRFRDNLRALITNRGWTQREAAERLGLSYLLLRKYLNRGLARTTDRSRPALDAICKEFEIENIELLWAKNLQTNRPSNLESEASRDGVVWMLRILLHDLPKDRAVQQARKLVNGAFDRLTVGLKGAHGRANGRNAGDPN